MSSAASIGAGERDAWIAPAMNVVPIGTTSGGILSAERPAPPQAPAASGPSSKLGFAFEMSFPMSARTTD